MEHFLAKKMLNNYAFLKNLLHIYLMKERRDTRKFFIA